MKSATGKLASRPARGQRRKPQGPHRTDAQRQADYDVIAIDMLNGVSNRTIAKRLGISHQQIALDKKVVIDEWVKERNQTITQHKAIELTKLERLEAQLHKAFAESRRIGKDGKVISAGNPKFLELIMKSIFERMHVHGVYAAAAIEHRHSGNVQVNHRLAEADRLLEEVYGSTAALPATVDDDIIEGVVEPSK